MKKLLLTFLISILLFATTSVSSAEAHILKTSKSVGVVFHLEPDHDPVVGENAFLSFELKDKTNTLLGDTCDCSVEIYLGDKLIVTKRLFADNLEKKLVAQHFEYAFPQKGVYSIKVIGNPINGGAFDSFLIEYDQRVDKGTEDIDAKATPHSTHTPETTKSDYGVLNSISFLIVSFVVIVLVIFTKKRRWFVFLLIVSFGIMHFMPIKLACSSDHCTHRHNIECCIPILAVPVFQNPQKYPRFDLHNLASYQKIVLESILLQHFSPRAPPSVIFFVS